MYDLSVALHVVAALVGFGVTFAYPVLQVCGERGDRRSLPFALGAILALSRWLAVPATTVVGLTGGFQLATGPYGLDDAWALAALVLYLAVMAVAVLHLAPAYRRAREEAVRLVAAAGDGPVELSAAYRARTRAINVVGPLVSLAVLATLLLMVFKPG